MMNLLVIVGIIFLFAYGIYRTNRIMDDKAKEKIELLRKQEAQKAFNENLPEEEPEPVYQLQTHKVKYQLYNPNRDLRELNLLYKLVVHKHYWINEPFHTKFYKILLILDKNDFMILDPNSKVLTINLRDENNKTSTSKSYQVYSTSDIIKVVIPEVMGDITIFNKKDAQNILIAIFILALEKSVHYLSKDAPINTIKVLLGEYKHSDSVKHIISLIKEKNSQLVFVIDAFKEAFRTTQTLPYNDTEIPQQLQIPEKLPVKFLQEI